MKTLVTSTHDDYSQPACDACNQPIRGGIYRRGLDRLCRACHHQPRPPSTTPFLGCQVVRFERPCEPATPPPPPTVPATPTPKATARTTAPVAASTRTGKGGEKAPRARPPRPPRDTSRTRIPAVLAAGPMTPGELADAVGIRRGNIANACGPLLADGAIQRTRGWYHLPAQRAPTRVLYDRKNTGVASLIRTHLTEPMSLPDIAARCGLPMLIVRRGMRNAGARFDGTAKKWRVDAEAERP